MDTAHLEKTVKEFVDSLLSSKNRHTLCLNIAEPSFKAEDVAVKHVGTRLKVEVHAEPSAPEFEKLVGDLAGKLAVVTYDYLDHHPKVIAALLNHLKNDTPSGKLVIVSREWNSDNTERERELRKSCLFYQQNPAKPPRS